MNRTMPFLLTCLALLLATLLAACGTGAPPSSLKAFTVPARSLDARLETAGVKAVDSLALRFNGAKDAVTLDHPTLKDDAVTVPLSGHVCYGKNHVAIQAAASLDDGRASTLTSEFDFWFAPALPTLTVPDKITGLVGQKLPLAVQVATGIGNPFAYACSASVKVERAGTEVAAITLPVPGKGAVDLPAMDASGDLALTTHLQLGAFDSVVGRDVMVTLTRPAKLTLVVQGVDSAPVLITQGDVTVFSGAVTGQTEKDLPPGTYLVDGLPVDGYEDPPASTVTLTEGQVATLDLSYQPGPPPPVPTGITLVAPQEGATITEPSFSIAVHIDQPGDYRRLEALFAKMAVLLPGGSWSVSPTQQQYSTTVTLNPSLYNGPHTLLLRAEKLDGTWVDGPSADITMNVPWLGSAYLDFSGLPATVQLYPDRTVTLSGTVRSRNGYAGVGLLGAAAPLGVSVTVTPSQHTFVAGEALPVSVVIRTVQGLTPGTYASSLTWKDTYGLRSGTQALPVDVPNPLQLELTLPAPPVQSAPVALAATLPVQETDVSDVEFFSDGVSLGKVTSPPYTFAWQPGLLQNGSHAITATVHSPLGYSAGAQASLDLRLPFGVRQSADAGQALTLEPVTLGGAVFTGGGSTVARIDPADLTMTSSAALGGTLQDLFAFNGMLYAASDSGLWRLAPADLTVTPVAVSGSGYCCHATAGSHGYVGFGSVVTSIDGGWTRDVGGTIRAMASDGSVLMVLTDTQLLAYTANGEGPVGSASSSYVDVSDMALTSDAVQILSGTSLLARSRILDALQSSRALDASIWQTTQLDVTPDALTDPEGGATADVVAPSAALAAPDVAELAQSVSVVPGATYTFSFWYLPEGGAPPPDYAVRAADGTAIVGPTPYWTDSAPTTWTRVTASVPVPAGVTSIDVVPFRFDPSADPAVPAWPVGADLGLWGVRLDYGGAAGGDASERSLGSLCGPATVSRHDAVWWLGDQAGCVTSVSSTGTVARPWTGVAPVTSVLPVATGSTLVALQDGNLVALSSTTSQAAPVAGVPLGFGVNGGELVVPYADGTVRRLDGPLWP